MITTDNTNFQLSNCTVKFLGLNDILKEDDFIRNLNETGENGGFNTTFKIDNWEGTKWHLLKNELSGWIGKTYADYMKFVIEKDIPNYIPEEKDMWHEIVRVL